MRALVRILAVTALGVTAVACGGDDAATTTTTEPAVTTTTEPDVTTTTEPEVTTTTTTEPEVTTTTTTEPEPTTTAPPAGLGQLVVWPDPATVLATPEEAAASFVDAVFWPGPALGEFVHGDVNSGEIDVFATEEGQVIGMPRMVLSLRRLGPDGGWFVIGAFSRDVTIEIPEAGAVVLPGPLVVEGVATGFEANVLVEAFLAGDADRLDVNFGMAGNYGVPEPYSIEIDLSAASLGDIVVILVRGDTGLETDPGEASVIPILIG